ncbi:uncharacterized protein LOC125374714 [Haliotis rufescens]|uniref:uncharacterized protein LOC125374714 n=1 Tax=Haliotis rufescens TaxID=6454 RepID=UPI00201F198B|nr:uncharacterized protein LOC125374714 [Haliotis rufescens]
MGATHTHVARAFGCSCWKLVAAFKADRKDIGQVQDRETTGHYATGRPVSANVAPPQLLPHSDVIGTVPPYLQQQPRGVLYQHDNARPHTARIVVDFLANNNVNVLPWPACSPDLSLIEHLWDVLDRRVRVRPHPPANRQELIQALQDE